jgi:4-amino-4-deoxy-L-arabinose transferase-like glycosyltransferase
LRKDAAFQRVHNARGLWLALRGTLAPLGPALLLALAVYLGLFLQLGRFPLFDVDEGAFSEATREMLARGDYVTTWLNGELRFDKPIFTYWLQAASVTLFGLDEFALRLPSALASCAWVAAIFVFTRGQLGQASGHAAAFIAATTLGVCVIGRGAIADALLNLFLALSMFDIFRSMQEPRAPERTPDRAPDRALYRALYRYRAFLWMALGLLTKGPVALLVPFAASGLAFSLQGRWRAWLRAAFDPLGWLILALVAGPWYVVEYLRQGDAFIAGFFLRHNVERFLSPLQGHSGNVLYYLPVVLLVLLPYTGLFVRVLPTVRRLRADPLDCFLWCWFLFVFVFFSLAGTKLPHYLLYGVTPLFVLMARYRGLLDAQRLGARLLGLLPPVLLLALVVALPHALQQFAPRMRNLYFREMLTRVEVFSSAWQAGASALLLGSMALALVPRVPLWPRLLGCALLCAFAVGALALPALAELQQGPVKEAALIARSQALPVKTWRFNVPSFSVYRGAVTERASTLAPGDVILTRSDELQRLGRVRVIYRKGGVVLARIPS